MVFTNGPDTFDDAMDQLHDCYTDPELDGTWDWDVFGLTTDHDLQAPRSMAVRVATATADTRTDGTFLGRCITYGDHVRGETSGEHPVIHGPAAGVVIVLNRDAGYDRGVMTAVLRHELAHCEELHRYGTTCETHGRFKRLCRQLNAPHKDFDGDFQTQAGAD